MVNFGYTTLMTELSSDHAAVVRRPCGPDLDAVAEAVSTYADAGFTDIAVAPGAVARLRFA